ncbi:MAG: sigma 54-interacting transcriptional regulator [Spirochaetia bacterium]|jgi:transcriptional regulator with PAS, ATPase and Fis domain|nr:sigma 54-interacting transcriptional regulator [Spirochaetia bacterium]
MNEYTDSCTQDGASPIVILISNKLVSERARKILQRKGHSLPIYADAYSTDDILRIARHCIAGGTRVIISRGKSLSILRDKFDLHVVDIRHTLYEFPSSLAQVGHGSDKVAFIGFSEFYNKAQECHLVEDATVVQLRLESEIPTVLRGLKRRGITTVIGGGRTVEIARQIGLNALYIEVEEYSLEQAIDEAFHSMKTLTELDNKNIIINSIIESVSEGIVGIDQNGCIFNMNPTARKLLGIVSGEWQNRKIEEMLPALTLPKAVRENQDFSEELIIVRGNLLSVSGIPIRPENSKSNLGTVLTIQEATKIQSLESKVRKSMIGSGHIAKASFDNLAGHSENFRLAIDTAKEFAQVTSTILISGETGTGKELFAQSIHNFSKRAKRPFIAINCAVLPPELLESELFGYVKGAFTGADLRGKMGLFESAHTGTIFLDEIGEMPFNVQAKLLRVLQEKEISRLGDDKVIPVDVRILSATNKNLITEVEKGNFREDLYYRICVLSLTIPPLRERKEDIIELAMDFVAAYNQQFHKAVHEISPSARRRLMENDWPGNIRQLRNVIERAMVLCKTGVLGEELIPQAITPMTNADKFKSCGIPKPGMLSEIETSLIKELLAKTGNDKYEVAKILGMSVTTLWRRMREMN